MSQIDTPPNPTIPPEDFVDQVKQALEHLYDFTFLQRLPLAAAFAPARPQANQTLGHHLRRELITAIEAISPGPHPSSLASDTRLYNLLQLRYIEGITVQDAANRLGLSARQAHRSLRRGEKSVAAILWSRRTEQTPWTAVAPDAPAAAPELASARELSSVAAEMSRLETHLQPLDLRGLLQEALRAVAPLAELHGFALTVTLPDEAVVVSVDTAVADDVAKQRFADVIDMMRRPERSTFAFVMYPESTPIIEAYRASQELATLDIPTGLAVANFVIPAEQADTPFTQARRAMQARYLAEIQQRFDVPVLTIPLLPQEVQGLAMLAELGAQMYREPVMA